MEEKPMLRKNFYLRENQWKSLFAISEKKNVSIGFLIRSAIDKYLGEGVDNEK